MRWDPNFTSIVLIVIFYMTGMIMLAILTWQELRWHRTESIESNANVYAATAVREELAQFGSYEDRELTDEENFEFYRMFYIESVLETERA